jgi:AraC-like DNA-binding protein
LVFIVVKHSTSAYLNRLPDVPAAQERECAAAPAMDGAQIKEISDRVTEYLQTSKAYINPELSANELSIKTGIHSRNISIPINGYLHKNFFDLVNEMRIEEAKRLLLSLDKNLTVDSIYPDCGFRNDRSFFRTFKKFVGISPDIWRKNNT